MWFKRKGKIGKEEKAEKRQKEYVSGDTPVGRKYNEMLNKHFDKHVYSDALTYELMSTVSKRVDLQVKMTVTLEERVETLERMCNITKEVKGMSEVRGREKGVIEGKHLKRLDMGEG